MLTAHRRGDAWVTQAAGIAALVLGFVWLNLEIRHAFHGSSLAGATTFTERSIQTIAWLAAAYALYARPPAAGRSVAVWGWRILAGLAVGQLVFLQILVDNPWFGAVLVGSWPFFNLLLPGYLVPAGFAVLFMLTAHRRGDAWVTQAAGIAALVLGFVWLYLEIRHAFHGSSLAGATTFAERSTQTIAWLAAAYALYAGRPAAGRSVAVWGWRILAGLAVGQVFLLQVLMDNVWRVSISVGSSPVFNLLLLGYLAPAGFALLFMRAARARGDGRVAHWAGIVALVLGFVWLNSEIRHLFHGGLVGGTTTNAELYAYSLGWLAYAAILLALALRQGGAALRYASLVLVLLTAGKAVFFDMAALTGIWRALSFFGVGLAAVGVSYLYRRYVFPPRVAPAPS